jgi:hypothetical protein
VSSSKVIILNDPWHRPEGSDMQFRLTYEGQLLGASRNDTRAKHKHEIRKAFHPQLKRLWSFGWLSQWQYWPEETIKVPPNQRQKIHMSEDLARNFTRNGYRFVPLCTEALTLLCRIDVLFLRPDAPGSLIKSGDLDNRLKTLFDALRIPTRADELGGYAQPEADVDPFYCLLEDDKLISHVSVETDILLQPTSGSIDPNDARLVLTVTVRPANITMGNIAFL